MPYSSTLSAALICVKSVLTSPTFHTTRHGAADPHQGAVRLAAHPRPPAPVRARMIPAYRVFNAVMRRWAGAADR